MTDNFIYLCQQQKKAKTRMKQKLAINNYELQLSKLCRLNLYFIVRCRMYEYVNYSQKSLKNTRVHFMKVAEFVITKPPDQY